MNVSRENEPPQSGFFSSEAEAQAQKIDQFLVTDVKIHSKLRLKFELIKLFTMKWNFSNVGNAN